MKINRERDIKIQDGSIITKLIKSVSLQKIIVYKYLHREINKYLVHSSRLGTVTGRS